MKSTSTATVVVLLSILAVKAAQGQPALEELEALIRQERAGGPAEKADNAARQPAGEESHPEQGYLGVVADERKDRGRGVRILEVLPDGPAQRAGLRAGDLITGLANVEVRKLSDMSAMLERSAVGAEIGFQILRGDKPQRIKVTLGRRPPPEQRKFKQLDTPEASRPDMPVPAPIAQPPAEAKEEARPLDDNKTRIEMLERRIRELEERIARLERALAERR